MSENGEHRDEQSEEEVERISFDQLPEAEREKLFRKARDPSEMRVLIPVAGLGAACGLAFGIFTWYKLQDPEVRVQYGTALAVAGTPWLLPRLLPRISPRLFSGLGKKFLAADEGWRYKLRKVTGGSLIAGTVLLGGPYVDDGIRGAIDAVSTVKSALTDNDDGNADSSGAVSSSTTIRTATTAAPATTTRLPADITIPIPEGFACQAGTQRQTVASGDTPITLMEKDQGYDSATSDQIYRTNRESFDRYVQLFKVGVTVEYLCPNER